MGVVSMKQLLEAGVHFGHLTKRWNPKMAPYIFTERNGIYIIDLQKTVKKLDEAYAFVRSVAEEGENVLFVGTKKQAGDSIKEEALRAGAYYVNARWLGGMMTNFKTIQRRIARLEQLHKMQEDGTFNLLPKKEVVKLELEIEKLEKDGAYFAPVKVDGTQVTLGVTDNSLTLDLAKLEQADQVIVDVVTHGDGEKLTLDKPEDSVYNVATLVIPPAKTALVAVGTKVNEMTGKEEPDVKIERLPLDVDAVRVTLWPLPFEVYAEKKETNEDKVEEDK